MALEEELSVVTFKIYLYLVRIDKPVGPRDVTRDVNLSSPAVAHRGLQKLTDLGLAYKDEYGRYTVKEKISFKGYVWLGKNLVPRFILYGLFFTGLLIPEIAALVIRWLAQEPIEPYIVLTAITIFSAITFLIEGLHLRKKYGIS
ncbi:MAG: hypothetical protein NWE95_03625 [Candidatus Bathyarchaeota archaeon]|nr:hypothetical protein [Candidatus Bathyarchaeota archaeon]